VTLEDEVLATCGGLLGAIEALAYELPEKPPPRTERALQDARRFAANVRDHVEALSWLALPELETTSSRVAFSVSRWVEHACRGALPRLSGLGITLHWPSAEELRPLSVALAVSRMDRALTVMLEQLGAAVGSDARIVLDAVAEADDVRLTLSAERGVGHDSSLGEPISPLLLQAWARIIAWHRGSFAHDADALTITCVLPRAP